MATIKKISAMGSLSITPGYLAAEAANGALGYATPSGIVSAGKTGYVSGTGIVKVNNATPTVLDTGAPDGTYLDRSGEWSNPTIGVNFGQTKLHYDTFANKGTFSHTLLDSDIVMLFKNGTYLRRGATQNGTNCTDGDYCITHSSGTCTVYFSSKISNGSALDILILHPVTGASNGSFLAANACAVAANKLQNASATAYSVGGTKRPVYFSGGIPVACGTSVGSTTQPVYIDSNGNFAVCTTYANAAVSSASSAGTASSATSATNATNATNAANIAVATGQTGTCYITGVTANDTEYQKLKIHSSIYFTGGNKICATYIQGAVWNDLVDCIEVPEDTEELEHGYCYALTGDSCKKTSKRAQKNAVLAIHSNTAGFIMGEKENKKTIHMALAGFVLAYTDKSYKTMTPLTCTKDGRLTKMNWLDRIFRKDALVGYYYKDEKSEDWNGVAVSGRNWVKIK